MAWCPHAGRSPLDSPPISTSFGAKLTISDQTIYFCAYLWPNQQHDNIWQSNVPRFVSRCSCLVFHEVGWSSIACSKRLLVTRVVGLSAPPPPSLPLNAFFLLLFRSIEKIFLWRCDSHFQGEMRRGDGATVLSSATIATNSHLQDTNWWVGPGWAVEDDGGAGSSMLKRRMRWKFKKRGGILSTRIGILNLNP